MTGAPPRIWALLGHRSGDNAQVLALAEELGLPFETRSLRYNRLRALGGNMLGASLMSVEREASRFIAPPWPDLVIAIGRRSVPAARFIQHQSGGRAKLVLIGHPRVDPAHFDLVITTRQYPVPKHPNVLLLPMAMSRLREPQPVEADEKRLLDELPRPHLLFAVGGSTKYHDLLPDDMAKAARSLAERASKRGGRLIVVSSPRSDKIMIDAIARELTGSDHRLVLGKRPRFAVLLDDADEIYVTADSMSMMSEAILTGKPVGMVPIALNATGRKYLDRAGATGEGMGKRRDMSRIWTHLKNEKLIGSIDEPLASRYDNPVVDAAKCVRTLLSGLEKSA